MKKYFGYVIERLEIGGKECYQALSFTVNEGCIYTNLAKLVKDEESEFDTDVVFMGLCDTKKESVEFVNKKNMSFIDQGVYTPSVKRELRKAAEYSE